MLSVSRRTTTFPEAITAPGRRRHREQVAQQMVTWGSLAAPPSGSDWCSQPPGAPLGKQGRLAQWPRPEHLQRFALGRGWRLMGPTRGLGESRPGLRPGSAPGPARPWTGSSAQASSSRWRNSPVPPAACARGSAEPGASLPLWGEFAEV